MQRRALAPQRHRHVAAVGRVAQRVVDEVVGDGFERGQVQPGGQGVGRVQRQLDLPRHRTRHGLRQHAAQPLRHVQVARGGALRVVQRGQVQQLLRQVRGAGDGLLQVGLGLRAFLFAGRAGHHMGLGGDHGQRGADLVRRILHKGALAFHLLPQLGEEVVQRLLQGLEFAVAGVEAHRLQVVLPALRNAAGQLLQRPQAVAYREPHRQQHKG